MNNTDPPIDPLVEDLLARMPAPPPPAAEVTSDVRARALEAFDRASSSSFSGSRWQQAMHTGVQLMSHPVSRTAAALAATLFLALWLSWPRHSVAFGDFLAPLMDAKTAKFKMTLTNDVQPKPLEMTAYFLAPHLFRQELPGTTNISDFDRGKMLSLDATHKQATLINLKNFDDVKKKAQSGFLFGNLRNALADYRANKLGQLEELGEKDLDGRRVFGFRLAAPTMTQTIWGDVETGNVTRIEASMPGPPKMEVVFTDFTFDMPLEASLFSVDPPANYKVTAVELDVSPATEQQLIETLRELSDAMDGEFPGSLDAAGMGLAIAKLLKAKGGGADPSKEQMNEAFRIGKGMNFPLTLPTESDAHYAGKGVKREGPRAAIFWYKPVGAQTYRVIYSDLSTADVDQPPQVPGAVRIIEQLKQAK